MIDVDPTRFPERPPSEVEWEELLVRYELAPRALSLAVDDTGPEPPEQMLVVLAYAVAEEHRTAGWLERARTGEGEERAGSVIVESAWEAVGRFAELRARNFAAVQRRGISVWEWAAKLGGARITTFQLLSAAVERDGKVLAEVRGAARGEAGAC